MRSDAKKENKLTGQQGEEMACKYLTEHGYAVLERNWRLGKNEVDIIAYGDERMIFVEVKTRANKEHGMPEDAVNRNKQRTYVRIANAYLIQHNRPEEARFDIISIVNTTPPTIEHLKNAYTAVDVNFR